jgi:Rrf2 family protein
LLSHLLVEDHADQQGERVLAEEGISLTITGQMDSRFRHARILARLLHEEERALWGPSGQNRSMHIPAKVDYGIRALLALAAAGAPQTAEFLAGEQGLPPRFLGAILADLRRAGIVASQRGAEGGYRLARGANEISIADVIRALDGPLAEVRGYRPELTTYDGAAENLQQVWVAVRASLRSVLEKVSLADVIAGSLPNHVKKLTADPDAWVAH